VPEGTGAGEVGGQEYKGVANLGDLGPTYSELIERTSRDVLEIEK